MKISKSTKYSAIFFLIFILGLIFFVLIIHKSLNKKTEIFLETENNSRQTVALSFEE